MATTQLELAGKWANLISDKISPELVDDFLFWTKALVIESEEHYQDRVDLANAVDERRLVLTAAVTIWNHWQEDWGTDSFHHAVSDAIGLLAEVDDQLLQRRQEHG